jgi:ketosteroid isomerase-like protein
MQAFIANWFARFDRLDPVDAFLPNLHPDVIWDMPDIDASLHGHDRFRAWYATVLSTFTSPTTHRLSDIHITENEVRFTVEMHANLLDGAPVHITAKEHWRYSLTAAGSPLITHYTVEI